MEQKSDMYGIDPAIIMNPKVWEVSGHVTEFTDPLVECESCHNRFREDNLEVKPLSTGSRGFTSCPNCGRNEFSAPKRFNLLFKTFLGTVEDSKTTVYLRGELAQAMFVDYPHVVQTMRPSLPFGIAAQGKVVPN